MPFAERELRLSGAVAWPLLPPCVVKPGRLITQSAFVRLLLVDVLQAPTPASFDGAQDRLPPLPTYDANYSVHRWAARRALTPTPLPQGERGFFYPLPLRERVARRAG